MRLTAAAERFGEDTALAQFQAPGSLALLYSSLHSYLDMGLPASATEEKEASKSSSISPRLLLKYSNFFRKTSSV